MSAADFLDSNVVLYLLSTDGHKADTAAALLADGPAVSVQVLNEVISVATRRLGRPLAEMRQFLSDIRRLCSTVVPLDIEVHEAGLSLMARYRFSIYGSLILAAALQAGCTTLYTDDLQAGQTIARTLTIRNPFTY